jgi:glucosyl-dolichyl phosphate glucuronosyltransferase
VSATAIVGDERPTISAIIPAHSLERWDYLESTVASVLDQSRPALEVIVAIDNNAELLTQAAAAFEPMGVRVLASEGAPGVSGARNTAVRRSTGAILAFLDDDVRAGRDWLEAVAAAHSDEAVAGTSSRLEPVWPGDPPAWLPPELYWVVGCTYRGLPTEVAPVRAPIGACMSFTRDIFDEAGGFTEVLGPNNGAALRCDDTEFGLRAVRSRPGTVVLFLPDPPGRHAVPPERARWSSLVSRCWVEGQSKAGLVRLVGTGAGLSDERRYVARVLPVAFARGVLEALRGDRAGLARSAAIATALAVTSAGYAYGRAALALPRRQVRS